MTRLIVIATAFICLLATPVHAGQALSGPYNATVLEVIDGDTIRARVQIWLGQEIETLVRIDGIDTPEIKSRCDTEHTMALQAREILNDLIGGKAVSIRNIRLGKYAGRVLADIKNASGQDIASALLLKNVAYQYEGQKRQSWC